MLVAKNGIRILSRAFLHQYGKFNMLDTKQSEYITSCSAHHAICNQWHNLCVIYPAVCKHVSLVQLIACICCCMCSPAPLPVPVISADSSHRSAGPACVLMCSVTNASRVTLSFFKGSDLVSSDFSSSLSLPLDVESRDENSYSCVVNNSISNHSTLFNSTALCQPPPATSGSFYWLVLEPLCCCAHHSPSALRNKATGEALSLFLTFV